MNSAVLQFFLLQLAANPPVAMPDPEDRKGAYAGAEFELEGRKYAAGDYLELDAKKAKQLQSEGKLTVCAGGRCNKLKVGKNMSPGFVPWDSLPGAQKTEYDDLLVLVTLLKPGRQVICGFKHGGLELPRQFYFPWAWVRSLGFGSDATFEIAEDQSAFC